jgi:hypothetical protein
MGSVFPARFVGLDAARARFGDRVDRLGHFLLRGDPLADRAAEALAEAGPKGFAMLERALAEGPFIGCPAPVAALVESASRVPAWVDWSVVDRGGSVLLRTGWFGGLVLAVMSLPYGYAAPAGNKPLVFSGQLEQRARRRLAETSRFVHAVAIPGGMRPGADGFRITVKVRVMHAQVRRLLRHDGRWQVGLWGEPINQHDMAATTLLFSVVVLEGLRKLGFQIDRDEADDYVQLWRWVGYAMGCEPELLPASEAEARRLAELIQATQGPPDEDSRALTHALLTHGRREARDEAERRRAARLEPVVRGMCRELLGAELADQLGVPPGSRLAAPIARAAISAAERLRVRSPAAHALAVQRGDRYWRAVLELGLAGLPATFMPPEALNGRSAALAS